ncbi:MAG TPA: tetraacyldisaccharide 4'-kinase [Acidobacteriaceae bacterium]|nr:tetraacyldisaccharide 4'-kinase [Acidobacteriaceae bacterium]
MSARRPWAWPLVPLYRAVIALKDGLRRAGLLKVRRLERPVVSVGSISAGGAGKTPVVISLAKMLRARGWDVDVLSRGYGRIGHGVEWVAAMGDRTAERYGDEPVVIARATGVPVWVGGNRFAAGRAAESGVASEVRGADANHNHNHVDGEATSQPSRSVKAVHLLDDGFQHRQLARNFDVVLVTAEDLDDTLMPAGNLRERFGALRRADAIVIREDELEDVKERAWKLMREGAQMWVVRRKLVFPAPLLVFTAGLRPVAFCAIARPEGFQAMLIAAGCGVVDTIVFPDHHAYGMHDMERILELGRQLNATGFVTTEKDNVKLTKAMCERLETLGPLMTVGLEAEFADANAVVGALEARLGEQRA